MFQISDGCVDGHMVYIRHLTDSHLFGAGRSTHAYGRDARPHRHGRLQYRHRMARSTRHRPSTTDATSRAGQGPPTPAPRTDQAVDRVRLWSYPGGGVGDA
ncbi:hypothetical protein GCM10012279_07100 [Micromonospora yangpuensis]|nr:hypothetical protein GCM10012279_07100 [Micromonospora yangpuensis]